jgi:ketosteroid isomerase-like protein
MNREHRDFLVKRFMDAWTSQDVDRVLDCYTDDVRYHDPNTRGDVTGRDAMRRYLTRLFADWRARCSTSRARTASRCCGVRPSAGRARTA